MNTEQIKYSVKNVIYRKTRSSLTVLSILIGIAAIFALVSFGLGIQNYIDVLADEAGADKLFIQARSFGAPGTDDSFLFQERI
jgi:putative ABC transport system permease protein